MNGDFQTYTHNCAEYSVFAQYCGKQSIFQSQLMNTTPSNVSADLSGRNILFIWLKRFGLIGFMMLCWFTHRDI